MTKLLLFAVLVVLAASLKVHDQNIVGGWTDGDINNPNT